MNPKKTLFGLQEGKLLGHTIPEEGIKIDPKRIKGIFQINHPINIKRAAIFHWKDQLLKKVHTKPC